MTGTIHGEEMLVINVPDWFWIVYHVIVAVFIAIDLLVAQRKPHEPSVKESLMWVAIWIGVGLSFGAIVFYYFGIEPGLLYITAYTIEYSLSMDNLFVFAAIFTYFAVPFAYQHKTLYIGIISAIFMRAAFIFAGLKLLEMFHWMVYVFGAVLMYSGYKLAAGVEEKVEPGRNPIVRAARKVLPITSDYVGSRFIVKNNGKWMFTPLIVTLVAIETTDVLFAFDSVPAVIAITRNFFIAYTSNISAILGLRSLYFLLAAVMFRLKHLSKGLAIVLIYLGGKMIISGFGFHIPGWISMIIVFALLGLAVLASIIFKGEEEVEEE